MQNTKKISIPSLLLLWAIFFGEGIVDTQIRVLGIVITMYRIVIILLFIISIGYLNQKKTKMSKMQISVLLFLLLWICLAFFQIIYLISVDFKDALKEIIYILFGALIWWNMFLYIDNNERLMATFRYIKYFIVILILFGALEQITGIHWPISRFNDLSSIQHEWKTWGVTQETYKYISTGPFYNENDFSAALTIFFPFLFYGNKNKKEKIVSYLLALECICIILLNGSIISLGALMLFIIFKIWGKLTSEFKIIGAYIIFAIFIVVSSKIDMIISILQKTSLSIRLELYKASFELCIKNILFGVGPGKFEEAIKSYNISSGIINPHNYFLEILSQYGIFIFLMFLAIIFVILLRLDKGWNIRECHICKEVIILYIISSFAPSSFLDKSFSWLPIAIGIITISLIYKEKKYVKKNY